MPLLQPCRRPPIKLRLARDLVRSLKRGHPWIFADALRHRPPAPPGAHALLLDNKKGREIARGFYDGDSPLAFRACTLEPEDALDDSWAESRLKRAVDLRRTLFDDSTTGYRLINGEGDGLPGLVCDIYDETAVIQLDGLGPAGFWDPAGIAEWLARMLSVDCVYERHQARRDSDSVSAGQALVGSNPIEPVLFLENGVQFSADVIRGQKTGFFLDQRDNRRRIKDLAGGRSVLNLFGYTGGFSVLAGLGGARHVTTVDLAEPALRVADDHWHQNELPADRHQTITADAFEFLEDAARHNKSWELTILDPPSFASSKESVPRALKAYGRLIGDGAAVTAPEGILAAASCSSHVRLDAFLNACEQGISRARRRATLLGVFGQPADHPTPLVMPEIRYLKFVLMRVE